MEVRNGPVKNKEALLQLINAHANTIKSFGVSEFAIFGSFIRNDMNENSDIDFLVDFYPDKKTYKTLFTLRIILKICAEEKLNWLQKKD